MQGTEVVDMGRALADMVARYRAIPAEVRQANLKREREIRWQLQAQTVTASR